MVPIPARGQTLWYSRYICTLWVGITTETEARVLVQIGVLLSLSGSEERLSAVYLERKGVLSALTGVDQLRAAVSSSCWYVVAFVFK